ncbi:MAG TPA: AraC family transcriptional regulator [Roseomonas sp.]|jgi:AraC-like DNA-binding protein
MGADALSEVLRAVRLTGAVFFRLEAREPWVAEAPPTAVCAPYVMPRAQHVIEYHVIHSGSCWGGPVGAEPVLLEAGDIIAFPQGDPHILSSAPGLRQVPDLALYRAAAASGTPFSCQLGAAGPPTACIICGFLGCDARPFNPLLEALPRMLHLHARSDRGGSWMGHLVSATMAESLARRIGGDAILARLSELMFAELVRRHIEAMPAEETGWFAGLRDPHVGRALNLLHGRAAAPWTLDALAREVGMSRSSLAERFVRLVGLPPMQYLARWRMQLAAGLLANGGQQVARIAEEVGYDSEAAFSRAFHKLVGMPPVAWRRAGDRGAAPIAGHP